MWNMIMALVTAFLCGLNAQSGDFALALVGLILTLANAWFVWDSYIKHKENNP